MTYPKISLKLDAAGEVVDRRPNDNDLARLVRDIYVQATAVTEIRSTSTRIPHGQAVGGR